MEAPDFFTLIFMRPSVFPRDAFERPLYGSLDTASAIMSQKRARSSSSAAWV